MYQAPKRRRRWALALAGCALWAAGGNPAPAEGAAPPPAAAVEAAATDRDSLDNLKRQFERQKQELEQQARLLEELKARAADLLPAAPAATAEVQPPLARETVEAMVGDYLRRRDEAAKQQAAADRARGDAEGYKVGTALGMSAHWNPLNGLTFETPNKDFTSHVGLYFQFDSVWFTQSASLKPPSQLGDLQDGSFFRRIRPEWEGTAWEVMEWNVQLQLEQITNDVPQLNEVWVGLMNLPVLGTVHVGKNRIPQGLEAGTYTGNRPATFEEVSPSASAFYEDLGVGVLTTNSVLDQRVTWAAMFYRQDNVPGGSDSGQNGVSFGDGKYAYAGRLTALPIYENDGRCLLHLGASYGWRKAEDVPVTTGQGGVTGPTFIEFRTRPQLRDSVGDYGGTAGNNATPIGLPGNSGQIVDTGRLTAASSSVVGTELLYIRGPFSVQAEYAWASSNETFVPNPNPGKSGPKNLSLGDVWFDGGYVQMSYFLTGENRRYDRRWGRLSRNAIGSPYTPFWLTRGEDGNLLLGRGAWEVAARYSHLDLNNGPIQGGQTDAYEVGLNWYLNANFRINFEYLHQIRYQKGTGPGGLLPGDIDGFGIRTQLMF
jgi:phosphate-selective porin OprO/OprP